MMTSVRRRVLAGSYALLAIAAAAGGGGPPALAQIPTGEKDVLLVARDGETLDIGTLSISGEAGGHRFRFVMDEARFSDQFLSMRPFKCIDGKPMYCHLAYPYEIRSRVNADDLTDLSYTFLFITKTASEYGIDPYNGRFYRFEERDGELVGKVYAVDLNILAAPPEDGSLRPISDEHLDPLESESERFPSIRIR